MESILTSIKKLLGITEEYTHYDQDIIIHINSVFATLHQLGVGPKDKAFVIRDDTAVWSDFISDIENIESVKSYMYMKVKLMFDPPDSSITMEAYNRSINEFEWRLNVASENKIGG